MVLGDQRILKTATYARNVVATIAVACGLFAGIVGIRRQARSVTAPTPEKSASYVDHSKTYFVEPSVQRLWELASRVGICATFGMFAAVGGWWVVKRSVERRAP